MEKIDLETIKRKSTRGIIALSSRTFLLQIVAFGATFLLTIFLTPAIFGIFYVVSAIISFLGYFSDVGLAAALIQKKEEVTPEDLSTTFTIQQILIGTVVVLAFIFSATIARFYNLDAQGLGLLRALIVAFFLSSLKTIPSVLLERKLEFGKFVIPQIVETLGFYIVAVILAYLGFGIASFTWAVLVRSIVGLVSLYIIVPWKPTLGISKPVAKRLLKFGLPFQLNSFLALVKDDLLTVFLGKVLPFAQVGYIGWAKKWAEVPLRLVLDSVVRVTFPAFARIQESKETLGKALDRTLFGLAVTIFPISMGLLFFVKPLIEIVPRYGKWEPALFSFYLFTIASAIAALSTPLSNALNAVGKIKVTLWLMVMWTTLTWVLTSLFIHFFGFNGVAMALLAISATVILVVHLAKQIADFSFARIVVSPTMGVIVQGLFYFFILPRVPGSIPSLIVVGILGVILYIGTVWAIEKERLFSLVRAFRT